MRSCRLVAALLALVAVLLAGCAKDGVEPQEWAGRVCEALQPWSQEIATLTQDTQKQMSKATSPKQAKTHLVALLRGAQDASEDARRGVRAAGVPAVDDGQQIADRFLAALKAARDSYAKARKTVEHLSVEDTDAFYDGVVEAMDSLSKDYNAGALDTEHLSSEDLQQAFDTAPECQG
jgi:hypothetical protein